MTQRSMTQGPESELSDLPELTKPSPQLDKIAGALCKFQGALKPAKKDGNNPFFNSDYVTLGSVWDACRKPLFDNGLSIVQIIELENEKSVLYTILLHTSGQNIKSRQAINPKKDDPQGFGSALTYARRYGLTAMLGIVADEDDDGNAASQPTTQPNQPLTKSRQVDGYWSPSKKQLARLFAISRAKNANDDDVKDYMTNHFGVTETKRLTKDQYEEVCNYFEKDFGVEHDYVPMIDEK